MKMKKWVVFGLIGIFLLAQLQPAQAGLKPTAAGIHLVSTHADSLTLELSAPIYTLQDGTLKITGALSTQISGQPALPYFSAWLAIPPEGEPDLRILTQDVTLLPGKVSLKPFSPSARPSQLGETDEEISPITLQSMEMLQPVPTVHLSQPAWIRDQRVVHLEYRPFLFDAETGTLTWQRNLRVEVRFGTAASAAVSQSPKSTVFDQTLRAMLLNYDQGLAWRASGTSALRSTQALTSSTFPLSGTRLKIAVNQDGLYRLTYADLASAFNMTTLDPHNLRLYNQGREVAIWVEGESDSIFDPTDSLIFYGQKFNGNYLASLYATESTQYVTYSNGWSPQFNAAMLEKYTDDNVYWLVQDSGTGLRMSTQSAEPAGAELATSYRATVRAEGSDIWWQWHFTGEDTWLWMRTDNQNVYSHPITLTAVAPGDFTASIRGELVGRDHNKDVAPDHHTRLVINTTEFDNALWDGPTRYHFEKQVAQSALLEGTNSIKLNVIWDTFSGQSIDRIYSDWFEVEYNRLFSTTVDALSFAGDQPGARRYQLNGITSPVAWLVEITNPLQPALLTGTTLSGGMLEFQFDSTVTPKFYAAGSASFKTVKAISTYTPPDLFSASNGADYLIIAPTEFVSTAQRLATYRASQGLRTKVVDFNDLVNLFNFGIYHPIAIKNFLAYAFSNWVAPAPTYALLIGDGHWNFKELRPDKYCSNAPCPKIYMPPNLAWVDYSQGEVDSPNMLATIVGNDILPDLIIGRMPVNNATQLDAIIDKTIAYETSPLRQAWQNNLLFIADDADLAGDFEALSDTMVQDYVRAPFEATKIYRRDFTCSSPCGEVASAIVNQLNTTGALLVSYIGHGTFNGWAGERIFTDANIPALANGAQLPVILSMTCQDGYWFSPGASIAATSLAEELVRAPNKGAVATFSPTGWGESAGHDVLERGFFDAVFKRGVRQLGAATLSARLAVFATGSDRDILQTYTIFGDPALRLRSALYQFLPLMSK